MSGPIQPGRRRILADISVQLVVRVVNLILGVFVTLLLVRGLGTRSFGAWSAIFAVGQIVSSVGELGLNEIAVNRAAGDPDRERNWIGALLSLRLLLAVPMAIGTVIAVLLVAPTPQARVAGVIIAMATLVAAPTALGVIFQLRVRNDVPMAIMTFNSVIWGAGVAIVAVLSGSIVAFAAVFVGTSAITGAVTVVLALRMGPIQLAGARALWRPMLRVGIPAGVGGVLITAYVKLDQILVLDIAGPRQAGLYGAGYRLLEQIQFIPTAVMTTLFPMIAYAYANRSERVNAMLQSTGEYLAMASLPILAFTIVAARPVVTLLFARQFAGAAAALPMLAGAFVSIAFGYLVGNMVVVLELQRRFVALAAFALVLNAALNVALIPAYGFVAAAWITVATEFTVMSLSMRMVLRSLSMRPKLGRLGRTLLAASTRGVATWLARQAGVPLGGLVAIAAAIYLPALFALRIVTIGELRRLLAKEPSALAA
ncbi:MAG: flippase [Solirubrobacteraceae bacterium]